MFDSRHLAYAIRLTTGSLYHSTYPPGCLPYVCWLYDHKNCYFVSFPTLNYLNCLPKQWICFMSEKEIGGAVNTGLQNVGGWGHF